MEELQSQITLAVLVPYILQWLKGQTWFPLVGFNSGGMNRFVAAVVAIIGGFGLATHFDGAGGVLTISGLTIPNVWQGILHSAQQFLMQHAVYKTAIAPPLPGPTQSAAREGTGVTLPTETFADAAKHAEEGQKDSKDKTV